MDAAGRRRLRRLCRHYVINAVASTPPRHHQRRRHGCDRRHHGCRRRRNFLGTPRPMARRRYEFTPPLLYHRRGRLNENNERLSVALQPEAVFLLHRPFAAIFVLQPTNDTNGSFYCFSPVVFDVRILPRLIRRWDNLLFLILS